MYILYVLAAKLGEILQSCKHLARFQPKRKKIEGNFEEN